MAKNHLTLNDLEAFDYPWPDKLVALTPSKKRSAAKLLVYDRAVGKISHRHFYDLPKILKQPSLIVFNNTKVEPAKLITRKITGGEIELIFLRQQGKDGFFLAPKKLSSGSKLLVGTKKSPIGLLVVSKVKNEYQLRILTKGLTWKKLLAKFGLIPLPPYLKASSTTEKDRQKYYQTVFGQKAGSIAAPTASLHFDQKLLADLEKAGHKLAFVTLHVGLGTFASLSEKNLKSRKLHKETFEVDKITAGALNSAKKEKRPIIAVGTTSLRVLETVGRAKVIKPTTGQTQLFVHHPYKFKLANQLITNFHVPKSSLILLVDAKLGGENKWREIYEEAINKKYRFFSFGDGMIVL